MTPDRGAAWEAAPVALLRLDRDGRVVDANEAFLEWVGRSREEVVGRARLSELLSVGGRIYWETHLAPLLHVQRRVDEVAVELRGPGGRRPVLMTAVVRDDGDGADVHVALTGAQERSRYERELLAARVAAEASAEHLRALQQATSALSQAVGVDGVAQALLTAAVQGLGAAGATLWLTGADGGLTARGSQGAAPDAVPGRAAQDGSRGLHVADDGTVVVPLPGRKRLHGVLSLTPRTGPAADPLDHRTLTAVGQHAGLALERALLNDQTASVAHELQHALLTTNVLPDDRFAVTTVYRPAVQTLEVGGDWYDAFFPEPGVLAVVVGDVVGRGLSSATAMGQLRSAVRAVAGPGVGPAGVLTLLDRFVEQAGVGFMATMAYAEVELATGQVRYACAGHPPPLRVPAAGPPRYLWGGRSTPLGVQLPGQRQEDVSRLDARDSLLLYTDGLVERRERVLSEGLDLLADVATSLQHHPAGARAEVLTDALTREGQERDDVCVLLLAWAGDAPGVRTSRPPS